MAEENKHPPTTEEQAPPEMPGKALKMEQAEIPDVGNGPAPSAKVIDLSAVRSTPERMLRRTSPRSRKPSLFPSPSTASRNGKAHVGAREAQAQTGPPCKSRKATPTEPGAKKEVKAEKPRRGRPPKAEKTATEQVKSPKAGKTHAAPEEKAAPPAPEVPPTPRDATRAEKEEIVYEEIFITSFDGDVLGLYDHLGEYESIDELNHLAHVLSDLDQSDIEKFEAVIDSGEYTGSVHDLINLAQNLDCYDFYPGIDSEEALGRIYIEEMEMLNVPDDVLPYFDFEAYGRDVRINEGGHFAPGGYVFNNGGKFVERYHGMEDIPSEHRIFAYPKLNIREQMAAYQEVIDRSALNEEKLRIPTSREER